MKTKEELRYLAQLLWTEADNWWHEPAQHPSRTYKVDHQMLSKFKEKVQEAIDILSDERKMTMEEELEKLEAKIELLKRAEDQVRTVRQDIEKEIRTIVFTQSLD